MLSRVAFVSLLAGKDFNSSCEIDVPGFSGSYIIGFNSKWRSVLLTKFLLTYARVPTGAEVRWTCPEWSNHIRTYIASTTYLSEDKVDFFSFLYLRVAMQTNFSYEQNQRAMFSVWIHSCKNVLLRCFFSLFIVCSIAGDSWFQSLIPAHRWRYETKIRFKIK